VGDIIQESRAASSHYTRATSSESAIRRYEAETGAAAILADTGETFEQIATRKP